MLLGTMALTTMVYAQQTPTGTPGNSNDWRRGGNLAAPLGLGGTNNIFGTLWNSPIYTVTNGVNRTVLMGTNPAGSISGAFGIGSNLFSPLYKFHVQDFGITASDALGRMIRTDGILALENRWSIFTGTNAATALERFRISTNAGSNNAYLGTIQNGSFNIRTFDINRMKLNGDNSYTINSYTGQRNGYLLIGIDNNSMIGGQNIYTDKGAYSMLHLNGNGTSYQEYGYRPWMDAGVTFTANKDLSYIGLRKLSTVVATEDITETVLLWSDNPSSSDGPDKLVFRFSGFGGSNGSTVSSDRLSNTDLDALHVAQFTGTGLMGLGNTFGTNASGMDNANYNNPQSLLHMSYDWRNDISNKSYGFGQITYRRDGFSTAGTGETSNDGLRWGINVPFYLRNSIFEYFV